MLGGFGNLSSIDITGSRKFLSSLTEVRLNFAHEVVGMTKLMITVGTFGISASREGPGLWCGDWACCKKIATPPFLGS